MSHVATLFELCVNAIRSSDLIVREGSADKEFHFQNWFRRRLEALDEKFDAPGRNTYPDFRMVHVPEGYEVKGLAYPGRSADCDCNSQVPCGEHNGRAVYYSYCVIDCGVGWVVGNTGIVAVPWRWRGRWRFAWRLWRLRRGVQAGSGAPRGR